MGMPLRIVCGDANATDIEMHCLAAVLVTQWLDSHPETNKINKQFKTQVTHNASKCFLGGVLGAGFYLLSGSLNFGYFCLFLKLCFTGRGWLGDPPEQAPPKPAL